MRPALEHPNVTLLTNAKAVRLETNESGTAVTEVVVEREGETREVRRRRRGRLLRRRQLGQAPAALGERQASERPRQRLRPGRSQLHVPRQRGGARALPRGEPDHLPEDAGAERLLLRQRRLRVSARQHPDGRQVVRRRCSGARSQGRRSWRPSGRWSGSPATRSTSGCRPRTCRGPRTGPSSTATASSR